MRQRRKRKIWLDIMPSGMNFEEYEWEEIHFKWKRSIKLTVLFVLFFKQSWISTLIIVYDQYILTRLVKWKILKNRIKKRKEKNSLNVKDFLRQWESLKVSESLIRTAILTIQKQICRIYFKGKELSEVNILLK